MSPTPTPARVRYFAPQIGDEFTAQTARIEMAKVSRAIPPMATRVVATSGTANGSDDTILVDTTVANVTLTLPLASQVQWLRLQIKNIGSRLAIVSGSIDGVASTTLSRAECIVIQSDGDAWRLLAPATDGLSDVFNVVHYGAVADSSTNNLTAIQAAITAAQAVGGGVVYFPSTPAGMVYDYTGTLVITQSITFGGSSITTAIRANGLAVGQYAIDINNSVNPTLQYVTIQNLSILAGAGDCIRNSNASVTTFRNLVLRNCRHGIVATGTRAFSLKYEHVVTGENLTGTTVRYASHTGGGQHTFIGGSLGGGGGVNVDSACIIDSMAFLGTNFEMAGTNGVAVQGTLNGLTFSGCRFEKNTSYDISIAPSAASDLVSGLSVSGCMFNTNGFTSAINLGGGSGEIRGFSITGNYADFYSSEFVRLNGEGQSGVIAGNRLDTTPAIVNVLRPGVLVINNENTTGALGPVWNPPLVTPTLNGACTDLATAVALVNQIRLAVIADGFTL